MAQYLSTPIPSIYSRDMKVYVQTKSCMQMFVVALLKMPKVKIIQIFIHEGINKLQSIHTMEHCSRVKRESYCYMWQFGWFSKAFTLSERNQTQKLHTVWFSLFDIWKRQNYSYKNQIGGCQELEVWGVLDYKGPQKNSLVCDGGLYIHLSNSELHTCQGRFTVCEL